MSWEAGVGAVAAAAGDHPAGEGPVDVSHQVEGHLAESDLPYSPQSPSLL